MSKLDALSANAAFGITAQWETYSTSIFTIRKSRLKHRLSDGLHLASIRQTVPCAFIFSSPNSSLLKAAR